MKNKLHKDTALFWKCRSIVLNEKKNRMIRFFAQNKMNRITRFYNAIIPNSAIIKSVPITPHGLINIFISKYAIIGNNVTISQNVTIGSNMKKNSKTNGSPTIGDNCFIGANSCVIGGIVVGNNVFIGAGTTVVKDVPDNSTVVSAETRIIEREKEE